MQKYRVTAAAGLWVAGRRNPGAGSVIELTALEAAHDLRVGSIEPVAPRARPRRAPTAPDVEVEAAGD